LGPSHRLPWWNQRTLADGGTCTAWCLVPGTLDFPIGFVHHIQDSQKCRPGREGSLL